MDVEAWRPLLLSVRCSAEPSPYMTQVDGRMVNTIGTAGRQVLRLLPQPVEALLPMECLRAAQAVLARNSGLDDAARCAGSLRLST